MSTSSGHPGPNTPEAFAQHELAASASDRYEEMQTDRSQYIWRGRLVGEVTIPYLIPFHEGTQTASEQYMTPKSSVGARGVNNLANKLVMALMPPGQPFFKLGMSPFDTEAMEGEERVKIEGGLSAIEQVTRNEMEQKGLRSPMVDAMRSLIITGNGLLHVDREGQSRFYRLNQYVVQRDAEGTLLEIILRQTVAARTLPEDLQAIAFAQGVGSSKPTGQAQPNEDSVDIYTRTIRDGKRWRTWQEFENFKLPNTEYTTPIDEPAWLALTWTLLAGENYGRGPGEEYQGDLDSNESLQDSLITAAAASARTVFLVNEGGLTDIEDVAEADNGAVIEGREDDIGTIKVDKAADLSVAKGVQENIQQGLAQIFLLTSDNVRDAERVTAEEIRLLAQELETALGGVFSRFAVELQLPLARRFMSILTRKKKLPALPEGVVSPEVTTGLPALGRFASLQRLDLLMQGIAETFGPQAVERKVKMDTYIGLRAAELGVDITGLFHTDQELAEAQQAEHQRAMEQNAAAPTVNAIAAQQQAQAASQQPAQ
jgi:hypothetical protein